MPLSVQKLSDVRRTVTIPFDDDTLHVTYKLSAINMELADWTVEHGSDRGSLMDWLARVIVSWDIVDNGDPIPVTRETMERYGLPTPLLYMIQTAIREDSDEKNLRKAYSGGSPSN